VIVTIDERKARKVEDLHSGSRKVMSDLTSYALTHHGKFVIFGSTARGELRFDSDFDVVVDFPPQFERLARDYAERVCVGHGVRPDVHLKSEASAALMQRVERDGVILP
jgi:predicted nucleotidyltransferase